MNTPEEVTEQLIEKFVELRKARGWSHEKLAQEAGLSRPAISYIENGKRVPTILTCLKIAHALNCDLGTIIKKSSSIPKTSNL